MEDTSKANIVFNISGGNNQILPNAIKAEQNFYGDKYIEETMKAKTTSQEPVLSPETTHERRYRGRRRLLWLDRIPDGSARCHRRHR